MLGMHSPRTVGLLLQEVRVDGDWSELKHVAWDVPTQAQRCLIVPDGGRWKEKSGWVTGFLLNTERLENAKVKPGLALAE